MKWFAGYRTVAEIKRRYRELAKQYHPDHGGDADTFKAIGAEYEKALDRAARNAWRADQERKASASSEHVYQDMPQWFAVKIRMAVNLESASHVEIVGIWIWLTADPAAPTAVTDREHLKTAGFKYSGKHQKWYYTATPFRTRRRSGLSYAQIQARHGVRTVVDDQQKVSA